MKGKDEIKDLFSDKLGGYEAKVNPELWGKVASQIGTGTAATATGMSITAKIIIGLSAASVITVGTIAVLNSGEEDQKNDPQVAQTEVVDKASDKNQIEVSEKKDVEKNDDDFTFGGVQPLANGPDDITPDPDPAFTPTPSPTPVDLTLPGTTVPLEPAPIENMKMMDPPSFGMPNPEIEDPITISEDVLITKESQEIEVSFPNIFTPNNDGINDYLFVKNPDDLDRSTFSIVVLDDKNKEVYSSKDPYFKWNGYSDIRGEMLSAGRYIAIISCQDKDGNQAKPVMRVFTIAK